MSDLALRLHKDMLVVAPLLAWQLFDADADSTDCLAYMNILDEDIVRDTHHRYRMAGAQCVLANTAGANRAVLRSFGLEDALEDCNRAGMRLAREAGFEHVIAVVSAACEDALGEQLAILLSEAPDAFLLTNAADTEASGRALAVIREQTELPLFAKDTRADILLERAPSPGSLRETVARTQGFSGPLMLCLTPEAPEGSNERQRALAQSRAADNLMDLALQARALGVQFLSTTQGSSPLFTGALHAAVGGMDV